MKNLNSIYNLEYYFKACVGRLIDVPGYDTSRVIDENNLGGVVSIERVDDGKYHLKSDNLFKTGLTYVDIHNNADGYPRFEILDESMIEVIILTEPDGQERRNNRLYAGFWIWVYNSEELKSLYHRIFGKYGIVAHFPN